MSLGRQSQIARVTKGWKQQDLRQATGCRAVPRLERAELHG
jgi:hypothetical protein